MSEEYPTVVPCPECNGQLVIVAVKENDINGKRCECCKGEGSVSKERMRQWRMMVKAGIQSLPPPIVQEVAAFGRDEQLDIPETQGND